MDREIGDRDGIVRVEWDVETPLSRNVSIVPDRMRPFDAVLEPHREAAMVPIYFTGPSPRTTVIDSGEHDGLPSPSVLAGLLTGLLYAGAVTGYARTLGYPVLDWSPVILYPLVVLTAAGTVATYGLLGRRVVTPALALAADTHLWIAAESNPGPGDPYVGFVGTLPVAIGLMALIGTVELRIRGRLLRTSDPT